MPYGGTTPEQDKKIEKCVARLMKQGKEKSNAIAICKSSIMGKKDDSEPTIMENVSLSFNSPVTLVERMESNQDEIKVGGLAVPAQESRNGRTYKIEDLHAARFGGHPFDEKTMLTMGLNHSSDVTDNIGRWKPIFTGNGIEFQGVVYKTEKHPYIIDMLNKGLLPYVSVEMTADLKKEGEVIYAKNQDVLGLDFVKVPGLPDASVGIAEAFEKAYAKAEVKINKGDEMVEKTIEQEEKPEEEVEEVPEEKPEEKPEPKEEPKKEPAGESLIDKIFDKIDKKVETLEKEVKKLQEKPQSKGVVTEREKPEFNIKIEKKSGGYVDIYSEDNLY